MIYFNNKNNEFILDDGLFFSKGIFETILIKGKAIFLNEHIERLNKALKILEIDNKVSKESVENFISNNKLNNCILKIVVTDKNLIFTTREIPYKKEQYEKGFDVTISNVLRNSTSSLVYIKSTAYIENILEKNKAKNLGFDDVLFLNENGYLTESSVSNIFFVKDKKIYSPSIEMGLLNGTVRNWVIKNFDVNIGKYKLEDILNADEVFLTNSVVGIIKVKTINDIEFNSNLVIDKISKKYFDLLEEKFIG
ncbi:MAG: aminotransferase class IV [Sarcina sp.]